MVLAFLSLSVSYRSTSNTHFLFPFPSPKIYTKLNAKKYPHKDRHPTLSQDHALQTFLSATKMPGKTLLQQTMARDQSCLFTLTPPLRAINTLIRRRADRRARVTDTTTLLFVSSFLPLSPAFSPSTSPSPSRRKQKITHLTPLPHRPRRRRSRRRSCRSIRRCLRRDTSSRVRRARRSRRARRAGIQDGVGFLGVGASVVYVCVGEAC